MRLGSHKKHRSRDNQRCTCPDSATTSTTRRAPRRDVGAVVRAATAPTILCRLTAEAKLPSQTELIICCARRFGQCKSQQRCARLVVTPFVRQMVLSRLRFSLQVCFLQLRIVINDVRDAWSKWRLFALTLAHACEYVNKNASPRLRPRV